LSDINKIRDFPEKARTLLAYIDEPVMVTDPKGVLAYLNPRCEDKFGIDFKIAIGRSITEFLPGQIVASLSEGLDRMRKSPQNLKFIIEEDNSRYLATLDPIIRAQKLAGVVIVLMPESDQGTVHRLNQSLFNNLLDEIYRPINQLTMLFSREFEDQKEFHPFYHKSQDLVKETISAINSLIDISPVLMGEIKLARSQFQPSLLLKLARRSFSARAAERNIHLLRLDHKDLPELIGDQAKLNRILVIFLDHLLDQAAPGEVVGLSADVSQGPEPMLTYFISATGLYKSEENFSCLSGELSSEYAKHGADDKRRERNLVVACRLLLAMKGHTQVVSLEGVGTTLSFSVPMAIAEQKPEETEE